MLLAGALYLAAHLVLTRTRFGLYVYAIGGNEEATRLSGVGVRFHKTMVYVLAGLMSAVASVILTARLNSAQPHRGHDVRAGRHRRHRHRRHEPARRLGYASAAR